MIEKTIKEALYYAKCHLGLRAEDSLYLENLLLSHFSCPLPYEGEIDKPAIEAYVVPDAIVGDIVSYLVNEKKMEEGAAERDATWVMGLLTPLPSVVDDTFHSLYQSSAKKATDYLYDLSIKNNYIAKSKVDKNIVWNATYPEGAPLEISINLSKPEKSNKDIAKLVHSVASGYPKCLLCEENVGFEGSSSHPARENIRFIPLKLNGGRWLMQYSPYVYYYNHCIVFYEKHVPMAISPDTLKALMDFVDLFPHFFIGSNSDLPIVGGSILNHEHFQGGGHLLPLLLAKPRELVYESKKGTKVSLVDFYVTALSFTGSDREDVLAQASHLLGVWRHYNDPSHDIIADDEAGNHSTCTPFVKKEKGVYTLYLVLRNNRCDAQYPDGIFHAHPEYHHIKKEGIGLIEAAGLFILPARLVRQSAEVEDAVKNHLSEKEYLAKYPDLASFGGMIKEMSETGETSREYINKVCQGILRNVAVYKETKEGQEGLHAFLKEVFHE
jgi:UDPglucose--hexose-1-phosphate uridylyltransferase